MYCNVSWPCDAQVVHLFYSQFTGLDVETVEMETDRDNFMSPEKAVELGLIDGVI